MFIEGCYYFADHPAATIYKKAIVDTCVKWITEDLRTISEQLLEQTNIYYYPKTTIGQISVLTDNNANTTINSDQSFKVILYVNKDTYENINLKNALTTNTIKVIDKHLKQSTTVSTSTITSLLRTAYGNDVIALNVSGFGIDYKNKMLTVMSIGDRFSIKKKLQALSDNTLIVKEDVDVEFILHDSQ